MIFFGLYFYNTLTQINMTGYRAYYSYTLEDWKSYLISISVHPFHLDRYAYKKVRTYANLFCRDMRRIMINDSSSCAICGSSDNLQIDHIVPVSKGGKNLPENCQVLCRQCNRQKSNKEVING